MDLDIELDLVPVLQTVPDSDPDQLFCCPQVYSAVYFESMNYILFGYKDPKFIKGIR